MKGCALFIMGLTYSLERLYHPTWAWPDPGLKLSMADLEVAMNQHFFKRTLASLDPLFDFLNQFLSDYEIGGKTAFELQLAIEEVFANQVEHNRASAADISVKMEIAGNSITIQIQDFDVEDFDVSLPPKVNTQAPLEERRAGGLGLHLIHTTMDRIDYNYKDRTSTITLVKYLK
jgi:anti-sigma regulatory factor (Ser/Thr protein kinase)